jgi:hypothetical protein
MGEPIRVLNPDILGFGPGKVSERTETSKYLEENKSNEIP